MKKISKKKVWKSSIFSLIKYWNQPYSPLSEDQIVTILPPVIGESSLSVSFDGSSKKLPDNFTWLNYNGKNYVSGVKTRDSAIPAVLFLPSSRWKFCRIFTPDQKSSFLKGSFFSSIPGMRAGVNRAATTVVKV